MSRKPKKQPKVLTSRPSPRRADYQGASPEQVAKALLRHRPETERRE